jgi:hypothetical protein
MKTFTLCLLTLLPLMGKSQTDSLASRKNFNAIGMYAGIGLAFGGYSAPKLFVAEYTAVKNGLGLGVGFGSGSIGTELTGSDGKKFTTQVTYFPLYGSVKIFTSAPLYFNCDLGVALSGDANYESFNSTVFGFGLGTYPYKGDMKLPVSFRLGYQRLLLASDTGNNIGGDTFYLSFGFLLK